MIHTLDAGLVLLILLWSRLISRISPIPHWLQFVDMHLLTWTGVIISSILLIKLGSVYTISRLFKNFDIFFDESIVIRRGQTS